MKDTPRTDEEEYRLKKLYDASSDFEWPSFNAVADFTLCRQIERELAQAKRMIESQYRGIQNSERILCDALGVKDGSEILDAIQAMKDRVRRLEEAGDSLAVYSHKDDAKAWNEAKEAA